MFLEKFFSVLIFFVIILLSSCSSSDDTPVPEEGISPGIGKMTYFYAPLETNIEVFYYIPENFSASTPILFSFHGAQRNAAEYRDALITQAEEMNFIVIAPEFSQENFPNGSGYNLGNVYTNGNNPTPNTLLPEEEWAFSVVEPLFHHFKQELDNSTPSFHMFGHSAGAQFVHRLLMFQPDLPVDKAVVSASGWFTFPDSEVDFPYGIANSPISNMSLHDFFSRRIFIQVGANDNNPNAAGLRRNALADSQGLNRKERSENYYQFAEGLAEEEDVLFLWSSHVIPDLGHEFVPASKHAVNLIFEN